MDWMHTPKIAFVMRRQFLMNCYDCKFIIYTYLHVREVCWLSVQHRVNLCLIYRDIEGECFSIFFVPLSNFKCRPFPNIWQIKKLLCRLTSLWSRFIIFVPTYCRNKLQTSLMMDENSRGPVSVDITILTTSKMKKISGSLWVASRFELK